jgi:hypothetical protein
MINLKVLLATVVVANLVGCSANHHSIYRHEAVGPPSLTMVDAKQRAILAAVPQSGEKDKTLRFCAEPSPDVFAVIAQALSVGGSFGQSGDPKSIQAALNAAFSSSEQGSTIPRTQTTNMLREVMYRTCERYLSGGMGPAELSIQAVRDQRLIVSILAIEQLTGAIAPKPLVIGATANGSAGSSGGDAVVRLDEQHKVIAKKAEALAKKQAAFDELNGAAKDCDLMAKAGADKKEATLTQPQIDARKKCEAAAKDVDDAKKEKTAADDHYKVLANASAASGIPGAVGATLMAPVAEGGLDRGHSESVGLVSVAVREIVAGTFKQDEFLLLCLKVLEANTGELKALSTKCLEYIETSLDAEQAQNSATAAQIEAATQRNLEKSKPLFEQFWTRVSTSDQLDEAKLNVLIKGIVAKDWPKCFVGAKTKSEFQACFISNAVTTRVKRDLAKGKSNG